MYTKAKQLFGLACQKVKSFVAPAAVAGGSLVLASTASAIDTAAVATSIGAAEASALTVGEAVVATVAALIVIGLVISMVRKI